MKHNRRKRWNIQELNVGVNAILKTRRQKKKKKRKTEEKEERNKNEGIGKC